MTIAELRKLKAKKVTEVRTLNDENKVAEAEKVLEEVRSLDKQITIAEELEAEERKILEAQQLEKRGLNGSGKNEEVRTQEQSDAMELRAIIKSMANKSVSEEERALLANSGSNGEGYILPVTVVTKIRALIRQYKTFRDVVGYMPSTTLTGSFPVENFETVSGLVDFAEDGSTLLTEATDIKFKSVSYALKEKGAFVALSNTLLAMTDNDLIAYVAQVFAKKAMITENTMAVATLKANKTIKALTDWKGLKKSLNVDLDPSVLYGTVIVTNQDGFDMLDSA
ncbi:MAG: phage major capsid protein, partial [Bacillota bacterium]|nr:phage major capsid protein [Bacillota bacterium]